MPSRPARSPLSGSVTGTQEVVVSPVASKPYRLASSAFTKVKEPHGEVAPDETARVLLKPEGEGRYTSNGPPEGMFQHPQWKDVSAEVFLRVDNSTWTRFGTYPIERHIGSKGIAP